MQRLVSLFPRVSDSKHTFIHLEQQQKNLAEEANMVHSKAGQKRNNDKKKLQKKHDAHGPAQGIAQYEIPAIVPEHACRYCIDPKRNEISDNFDEDGYPLPKGSVQAGTASREHLRSANSALAMKEEKHFPFLELPPEIRSHIYDLAVQRPKQPTCIPERLLRPSEDLGDVEYVLRQCYSDVVCLPCQLHATVGTGHIGLSRASQQLHQEISLVTYTINTFSLHNLYYLQTFLHLIGPTARRCLKSLHFGWMLPEEDAQALGLFTDVAETYKLLAECKSLDSLSVDIDMANLLTWKGDGRPRAEPKKGIPHLNLIGKLRGVKEIRIAWKRYEDSEDMVKLAKGLAGRWALPEGSDGANAAGVHAEVKESSDGYWRDGYWRYIHWKARKEQSEGGVKGEEENL